MVLIDWTVCWGLDFADIYCHTGPWVIRLDVTGGNGDGKVHVLITRGPSMALYLAEDKQPINHPTVDIAQISGNRSEDSTS
jgi:hypothetical protein